MIGHADHERTLALAKTALGEIRALRQSAAPYFYEIWYTYATGHIPALNQTINGLIKDNGNLTEADFDRIHGLFFAQTRLADEIDTTGAKFRDEIKQVLDTLEAAAGSATKRTEVLTNVSSELGRSNDRDGLRQIVKKLVHTSKDMQDSNRLLEERLNRSRIEVLQLQANLEVIRIQSQTDPLTGIANRKYLDEMLEKQIADAKRTAEPLALLVADIDHFKVFNDTYGHLVGDQVLRLVGLTLKENVKGRDIAARYGGEEFVVVLPNTTLPQAVTVAEQIRCAVMRKKLMKRSTRENLGQITVSIGVAQLYPGEHMSSLFERADKCLYEAKRNGRNRVISEADPKTAAATSLVPDVVAVTAPV